MLGDNRQCISLIERERSDRKLIQHYSQGIQIGPTVIVLAEGQLGRKVEDGTGNLALGGHAGSNRTGDAEIYQLRCAIRLDQSIFGFEIAMNDAEFVGLLKR